MWVQHRAALGATAETAVAPQKILTDTRSMKQENLAQKVWGLLFFFLNVEFLLFREMKPLP